jgi:hypothetical protein
MNLIVGHYLTSEYWVCLILVYFPDYRHFVSLNVVSRLGHPKFRKQFTLVLSPKFSPLRYSTPVLFFSFPSALSSYFILTPWLFKFYIFLLIEVSKFHHSDIRRLFLLPHSYQHHILLLSCVLKFYQPDIRTYPDFRSFIFVIVLYFLPQIQSLWYPSLVLAPNLT